MPAASVNYTVTWITSLFKTFGTIPGPACHIVSTLIGNRLNGVHPADLKQVYDGALSPIVTLQTATIGKLPMPLPQIFHQ